MTSAVGEHRCAADSGDTRTSVTSRVLVPLCGSAEVWARIAPTQLVRSCAVVHNNCTLTQSFPSQMT